MSELYYNFNVTAQNAGASAYTWVSFTAGTIGNTAVVLYPTSASATYASCYPSQYSLQFAPGSFNVSLVVQAGTNVTGNLNVSPPVNVDIVGTVSIHGSSLGTVTLKAGQSSASFDFPVSGGASQDDAVKAMDAATPKP